MLMNNRFKMEHSRSASAREEGRGKAPVHRESEFHLEMAGVEMNATAACAEITKGFSSSGNVSENNHTTMLTHKGQYEGKTNLEPLRGGAGVMLDDHSDEIGADVNYDDLASTSMDDVTEEGSKEGGEMQHEEIERQAMLEAGLGVGGGMDDLLRDRLWEGRPKRSKDDGLDDGISEDDLDEYGEIMNQTQKELRRVRAERDRRKVTKKHEVEEAKLDADVQILVDAIGRSVSAGGEEDRGSRK